MHKLTKHRDCLHLQTRERGPKHVDIRWAKGTTIAALEACKHLFAAVSNCTIRTAGLSGHAERMHMISRQADEASD